MLRIRRHRSIPILRELCTLRSRYLYLASAYMYFASPITGHCIPLEFGYSRQSNNRSNKRSPLKKQHPCDATRMFFQARFRLDTASVCRSMFVTESKEYRRSVRNRSMARRVSACSIGASLFTIVTVDFLRVRSFDSAQLKNSFTFEKR